MSKGVLELIPQNCGLHYVGISHPATQKILMVWLWVTGMQLHDFSNSPFTIKDIIHSEKILAPTLPISEKRWWELSWSGWRKTTWKFQDISLSCIGLPYCHMMFINTHSWEINLVMIEFTATCKAKWLTWYILYVLRLYFHAGFIMTTVIMDMEFNKLNNKVPQMIINTTAVKEHVAGVGR